MLLSASACAQGFSVSGRTVLDANGRPFLIRGVNQAHAWLPETTDAALPAIASFGANTVRIALSSGEPWGPTPVLEVAEIIRQAKSLGLVTMLEVHNTTGYGQQDWGV
ncbi:cellulase family glycosylhydrolase, partial [Parvularcula dongshanensis]